MRRFRFWCIVSYGLFLASESVSFGNDRVDGITILTQRVLRGQPVPDILEGLWLTAEEVLVNPCPLNNAMGLLKLASRLDGWANLPLHIALAHRLLRLGYTQSALARFESILAKTTQQLRSSGDSCHGASAAACAALHGHIGACHMDMRNFSAAASRFRAALSLWPHDDGLAWQLALAAEYGGDWPGAVDAYRHWLNLQRAGRRWLRPAGGPALRRRTVAILCPFRLPDAEGGRWGPSSAERKGVGGSEEAVILLSRELVKHGWHVEVRPRRPPCRASAPREGSRRARHRRRGLRCGTPSRVGLGARVAPPHARAAAAAVRGPRGAGEGGRGRCTDIPPTTSWARTGTASSGCRRTRSRTSRPAGGGGRRFS
jgi:hypothetical protein